MNGPRNGSSALQGARAEDLVNWPTASLADSQTVNASVNGKAITGRRAPQSSWREAVQESNLDPWPSSSRSDCPST